MTNKILRSTFVITICTVAVAAVFAITSCGKAPAEPKSFAFDSWDTIAKVAEGGLDNLLETYKPIGGTFIIQDLDDENETLAKTKRINLEGIGNYKVRVIAENHDVCENGKTAALTFEFTKVINNVPFAKNNIISNEWESSELRNYLNNKLFEMFPTDLKSAIKTVRKDTCVGGASSEVKTFSEKVFPLSVSEIDVSNINPVVEGKPYKLYVDHPYKPGSDDDPRNKDDKNYWLRSPMSQNALNAYVIRVGKDEGFFSQVVFDDCSESIGVAPAFCI